MRTPGLLLERLFEGTSGLVLVSVYNCTLNTLQGFKVSDFSTQTKVSRSRGQPKGHEER